MSDYATSQQIAAFAQQGAALDSANWGLLATAASRLFDKLSDAPDDFFAAAGAKSDRVFIGDGTAYLKLDPYLDLGDTPVMINDGTVGDEDYGTENVPDYIEKDGMLVVIEKTAENYTRVTPEFNRFTGWPDGKQIKVNASWGFADIPSDVTFAVIQIALHAWRTSDPAFANISGTEKAIPAGLPTVAKETADKYRDKFSRRFVFA